MADDLERQASEVLAPLLAGVAADGVKWRLVHREELGFDLVLEYPDDEACSDACLLPPERILELAAPRLKASLGDRCVVSLAASHDNESTSAAEEERHGAT